MIPGVLYWLLWSSLATINWPSKLKRWVEINLCEFTWSCSKIEIEMPLKWIETSLTVESLELLLMQKQAKYHALQSTMLYKVLYEKE